MAKYNSVLGLDDGEPRGRSSTLRLILLLLVISSPLLYEGGRVVVSRWYGMVGASYEVPTPVYDYLREASHSASDFIRYRLSSQVGYGRWTPAMAVPVVFAFAIFGSMCLKKGH
ncbi:MAG: hypothetical protein U0835_17295 [Isosphaeraceae bacterium]